MLRPAAPADTDVLVRLTAGTGFFKPLETEALREVLDDYFAANAELGHRCFVWEDGGVPVGYVYHAPAAMTDRTWYLYWVAVDAARQGRGLGGELLAFVEQDVREQGGRLLLIETSSTPHYEPTRRFYRKYGYDQPATIPDFYADGDGMVVFSKRLLPPAE
ncbi:MAG TPA: GNAT family N-acetyltransferase [Urbifossiella sp.]|nr:GNAT family N-acetyltransferase [Urbifossiella sp.]